MKQRELPTRRRSVAEHAAHNTEHDHREWMNAVRDETVEIVQQSVRARIEEASLMATASESFGAKVRRGIFNPVARHLRADIQEDRLAEGIGMAFEQYQRSVAKGRPLCDALLVHACHMRAMDLGRRLAGSGGGQPKRDVFDERNFKAGLVEVLRLDGTLEDQDDEGATLGMAEVDATNPTRKLVSALDLESWLASLAADDRVLLAMRQAGHTLAEIGAMTGGEISTVCRRLHALGVELADRIAFEYGSTPPPCGSAGATRTVHLTQHDR